MPTETTKTETKTTRKTTKKKETLNLIQKLSKITNELPIVNKNLSIETLDSRKYNAVSEVDILNAVRPLEEKYSVFSYPANREVIESGSIDLVNKYGNIERQLYVRIKTTYRFVDIDNPTDFIECVSYGDGLDNSDKATGKASTYADKYALMKMYKIRTGDDPDKKNNVKITPTEATTPVVENNPTPTVTMQAPVHNETPTPTTEVPAEATIVQPPVSDATPNAETIQPHFVPISTPQPEQPQSAPVTNVSMLAVKYQALIQELEQTGIDAHSDTFKEYMKTAFNVPTTDIGKLITHPDILQTAITAVESIIETKKGS